MGSRKRKKVWDIDAILKMNNSQQFLKKELENYYGNG